MVSNKCSNSTFNVSFPDLLKSNTASSLTCFQVLHSKISTATMDEERPIHLYGKIEEAIKFLSTREPEDDDYISPEAAQRAIFVLYILRHAQVPAPRIIPGEDGEDVTFTWDSSEIKRFLTITVDNWNVTHLHRPTKKRAFRKYKAAIERPNDILTEIGEPVSYPSRVTSF